MAVLTLCSMRERFYSITNPTGPVFHHQQGRSVSEKRAGLAGGLESGQNGLLGCGHTHLTSNVIYLMRGWICSQIERMSGWGSLSRAEAETLIYCTSNAFQITADWATLAYIPILCHMCH